MTVRRANEAERDEIGAGGHGPRRLCSEPDHVIAESAMRAHRILLEPLRRHCERQRSNPDEGFQKQVMREGQIFY
jgi:hypothetical protein